MKPELLTAPFPETSLDDVVGWTAVNPALLGRRRRFPRRVIGHAH